MKKIITLCLIALAATAFSGQSFAQMKSYTWDSYKTKFEVPQNFRILSSTGSEWSGTNDDITLSIFPRTDENLSRNEMTAAVRDWAVSNGVTNLGEPTTLDIEKMNGYWGVMFEGYKSGFPVATMLLVDPDYAGISLYIWVSYREGLEDTVIDILMSFTPN